MLKKGTPKFSRYAWLICILAILVLPFTNCSSQAPATSSAPAPAAPAKAAIKLKVTSPFPGPPGWTTVAVTHFEELVTQRTKNGVEFENLWGGVLAGAAEALAAVGDGRADMAHYPTPYGAGKAPLGIFEFAFPFRPTDPVVAYKARLAMQKEFPQIEQEMATAGGKLLMDFCIMPYELQTRAPVKTLDDLKGKKIAVIALYFPDWTSASGAVPVTMPIMERYESFQRGVLDGEICGMDQIIEYKNQEVVKNYTYVGLGSNIAHYLTANLASWNKLPADVQKIMIDTASETGTWYADWQNSKMAEGRKLLEAAGMTFSTLPAADVAKWAAAMPNTPGKFASDMEAKGLPGKKMVESYYKITEDLGWKWPRKFAP